MLSKQNFSRKLHLLCSDIKIASSLMEARINIRRPQNVSTEYNKLLPFAKLQKLLFPKIDKTWFLIFI